jgi:hypothetical protein
MFRGLVLKKKFTAGLHRVNVERIFAPNWKCFLAQPPIYMYSPPTKSDEMKNKIDHEPILSGAYLSTGGI